MTRNIRRFYAGSLENNLSYDSGFGYDSVLSGISAVKIAAGLQAAKWSS